MSFRENLQKKLTLDRTVNEISATIRELPGQRYIDRKRVRELLEFTDFELVHVRDLDLYVRPEDDTTKEILVLDNELAIYHTIVDDVAMRKSPIWKEMISVKNIKKILNDQDVISSRGKDSLSRIRGAALAGLDLSWDDEDLDSLIRDAIQALEEKTVPEILKYLDFFFELTGFRPINIVIREPGVHAFGGPVLEKAPYETYENLVLFREQDAWLGLMKGDFSPQKDFDLARVVMCIRGEEKADMEGAEAVKFLADFAKASDINRGLYLSGRD